MINLRPAIVTPPAELPVTLAEAKAWLWVDHSDHDTLITAMLNAAISYIDGYSGVLGRCIINQTWRQDYESWSDTLTLPFPGVATVTHVKYYDQASNEQTVTASKYELIEDALGSMVRFNDSFEIPNLYDDRTDKVKVTFVAGFGLAAAIPEPIKSAIKMHVASMYANREVSGDLMHEVPNGYWAMLSAYRRVNK
jgi:uncharacterized phiE125 gp8 family phage protein